MSFSHPTQAVRLHTFVLVGLLATHASAQTESVSYKPRVINTTDLGADPDDEQSMVRQLVCANEFDIEGLSNQAVDDLRVSLRMFVPGPPAGNYVIIYYPLADGIEVSDVIHAKRD